MSVARILSVCQVLVPGAYAWSITVAPAAVGSTCTWPGRAAALLAFVSLALGTFLVRTRPKLAYGLGIWAFLGLSTLTWMTNFASLRIDRLDPVRAAAGAVGWLLFALGWGTPWRTGSHPEDNPRAQLHPKLEPRRSANARTPLTVAIGAVGAAVCLVLAWSASEPDRALLMHGVALAAAVALVTTSAALAVVQGQKRTELPSRQRLALALPWLMALIALSIIAFAWLLAR